MSQSVKAPLKAYKVGMTIVRIAVNNMCDHHGGHVGRLDMAAVSHAIATAAFDADHTNVFNSTEEREEAARKWYGTKKYDVMQIMKGIVKNSAHDSVLQMLFDEIHGYGDSINMDFLAEIVISGYTPNNCTSKQLSKYRKASNIIGKAAARLVLKDFEDNFLKNNDTNLIYTREQSL